MESLECITCGPFVNVGSKVSQSLEGFAMTTQAVRHLPGQSGPGETSWVMPRIPMGLVRRRLILPLWVDKARCTRMAMW